MPKGRAPANVEFLRTLKNLVGSRNTTTFAEGCGKNVTSMSRYLNGELVPGQRVLKDCFTNLSASQIKPLREILPIPKKQSDLPIAAGVYIVYDSAGNVLYIGKATSFRAEVWQALGRKIPVAVRLGPTLRKSKPSIRSLSARLSLYEIENPTLRHNVEALLLRVFVNQSHNTNIGKFR